MKNIRYLAVLSLTLPLCTMAFAAAGDAAEQPQSQSMTVSAATVQAATAAPSVQAEQKRQDTVLVSPRTGMRYVVNNPSNRTIIFQTEGLAPVSAQNIQRITATNPAISAQSQQKAQENLLQLVGANQPQASQSTQQQAVADSAAEAAAPVQQ